MRYVVSRFIDSYRPGDDVTDAYPDSELQKMVSIGHARIELDRVVEIEPTDTDPYDGMTVAELRVVAHTLGVEGYSGMKKAELIEALNNR